MTAGPIRFPSEVPPRQSATAQPPASSGSPPAEAPVPKDERVVVSNDTGSLSDTLEQAAAMLRKVDEQHLEDLRSLERSANPLLVMEDAAHGAVMQGWIDTDTGDLDAFKAGGCTISQTEQGTLVTLPDERKFRIAEDGQLQQVAPYFLADGSRVDVAEDGTITIKPPGR